jgi:co-chaperonin GroES (HSP10)
MTVCRIPACLDHSIDWRNAARSIRALSGSRLETGGWRRIIVEMLPEDRPTRILVPDNLRDFFRSCVGVVIASTDPDPKRRVRSDYREPPVIGTLVVTRPDDGVHIRGAELGDYTTENEVRVFGAYHPQQGVLAQAMIPPEPMPWYNSILCQIDDNMQYQAFGNNFVFKKDPSPEKTDGGIYLPDIARQRSEMATVVSVGPLCSPDLQPGQRISYNPFYVGQNGVDMGKGFDMEYGIADELAVNWVVQEQPEDGLKAVSDYAVAG